jgi:hypothetical protein
MAAPNTMGEPFLLCLRDRTTVLGHGFCVSPPSMRRPGFLSEGPDLTIALSLATFSIDCLGLHNLPTGEEGSFGHMLNR